MGPQQKFKLQTDYSLNKSSSHLAINGIYTMLRFLCASIKINNTIQVQVHAQLLCNGGYKIKTKKGKFLRVSLCTDNA